MTGTDVFLCECVDDLIIFVMPTFFDDRSAVDIVGSLNKKEVRALLLDYGIKKACFRSWDAIEEMILGASDEVKNVVFQGAKAKGDIEIQHQHEVRKRHVEAQASMKNVRRRIGFFLFLLSINDKKC